MAIVPAWAPGLHPFVVHFPITLLAVAVVTDLVATVRPGWGRLDVVATWLYTAGAASAIVAYFSGDRAAGSTLVPLDALPTLHAHADWAFRTTWAFMFFTSLRLIMSYLYPPTARLRAGALALALCGLAALATTVRHGSRLVFEYGIGVGAVSAPSAHAPGREVSQ